MDKVNLTINGISAITSTGTSILNAARENGIRIPTLCHHPHLEPAGACRLCIVEDEKSGRIMASCVTPISPGMSIRTDSPTVLKHRTNIVRLMIANHPESCIVCNRGNRCELRQIAGELGIGTTGLYAMPHYQRIEEANPFIIRDLTKCILCGKCIRADHELVMVGAIDYNLRGYRSRPATVHEMPLERSNCTFCGTCVSMCPTAALMVKNKFYVGSPQRESPTICGFCSVGCSLVIGSTDGQVVDVNPSHADGTVNQSTLCIRGHFAHDFLNAPQRLTLPLIRKADGFTTATWGEALDLVAERLLAIKGKYGPQSIGFFGSSKCTLEENYLFQKIARVLLATHNVDNGGSLMGRLVWKKLEERLDGGGRIRAFSDLDHADVILALGADPTQSVPVLGYYLKRACRTKRVPMIVADPRRTDLVSFSSLWLPLTPHSDSELINGLAAILLRKKSYNEDVVRVSTKGFEQYQESLLTLDLGRVSRVTGIDVEEMEKAAGLLEGKRVTFVLGHGTFQQRYGIQTVDAAINLALITGGLGEKNAGFYMIGGENNELGAWDMGTVPDALPGRQAFSDRSARKHWERAWHVPLSPDPGLGVLQMIREAEKGNLKALYVMGENPLRSLPHPEYVLKALRSLEFLVVQDILDTETTRLANVILPGAAFSEKQGSFTNMEGRIQSFEPVVPPRGDAKPDWEILDLLGRKLGFHERHKSIDHIRDEIRSLVPEYADIVRGSGTAWVRNKDRLGPIQFSPYSPISIQDSDAIYPLKAILGSLRCHLGCGTRTGQSTRIRDYGLGGEVEISHEDGRDLGIQDGDMGSVTSLYGSIKRKIRFTRDLKPGLVFVPRAFHDNDARSLLPLFPADGAVLPENNMVNVRIEKT